MEQAALIGSPRQREWAQKIREQALNEEGWSDVALILLNSVNDANWWIANRHDLTHLSFKQPQLYQCVGGPPPPPLPPVEAANDGHIQPDLAQARRESRLEAQAQTDNDAMRFATSVSRCPMLAEVAILALLSRLYKPGSELRVKLKARAKQVIAEYAAQHEEHQRKDLDAISRIMPKD